MAAALSVTVLVWAVGGAWLWQDRRTILNNTHEELERMTVSAAEHARRLLSLADLFLESIAPAASGGLAALSDPVIAARAERMVAQDPTLLGVGVIDHDLFLHLFGNSSHFPPTWVGDRVYVREAVIGRITVSPPIRSRMSSSWVLPIVRRIAAESSRIEIILCGIDLERLERYYQSIRPSGGGAVALIRLDGTLLARSPALNDDHAPRSLAENPLFQAERAKGDEGTVILTSPLDGIERMVAYKVVAPFDLAVVVSLSHAEALAPWWGRVWLVTGTAGLITLVIMLATATFLRLFQRLEIEAQTLENRVRERTHAVNDLLKRREAFLAWVSHELRTPLNAILGFSDALRHGVRGRLTPGQDEYLGDIQRSGQHLLTLVNDLLDRAAIDAGSLRIDEGEFAVAGIVDETVRLIVSQAAAAGIAVSAATIPPGLIVHGDRRRLLQALLNLANNAVKYGRPNGRVEIRAVLEPEGGCLISVRDDGAGMSQDEIALAISPFGRVGRRASGADEGTGLGLPLSIGIVTLHGGSLTLNSQPNAGTCAEIRLPAERVRPDRETDRLALLA